MGEGDVVVETGLGAVRGRVERGVRVFRGIPFAAPLTGPGRFMPPEPPAPWPGVRDATEFGATTPKFPSDWPIDQFFIDPVITGDEFLNLNIWAPIGADGAPVLVWMHGSAYIIGSGAQTLQAGAAFARDGVVCVTINYRLAAFGWLDLGDEHSNVGLRDQLAALRWVHEHIAVFGGDPGKVTLGGESAGGACALALTGAPEAASLFHRTIVQSGAPHLLVGRGDAQRIGRTLAERLGVAPTRIALGTVSTEDVLTPA